MRFSVQYKFQGKVHKKVFRSHSRGELESLLTKQHFVILSIAPISSLTERFQSPPKTKELLNAFYELKLGLKAHLPFDVLLENLQEHSTNKRLGVQFANALFALNSGKSLAQSFSEAGFSEFVCAMLRIGQKVNLLENAVELIITRLKSLQKNQKLMTKILLYPIFVTFVMICVFLGITIFVLPQFEALFSGIGEKLPLVSQSLLFMRKIVLDYGLLGLCVLCVGALLVWNLYCKNLVFKEIVHRISLKLPFLGKVLYHFDMVQFLLSFFWLYRAKVPLQESLEISLQAFNNLTLKSKACGIFESIVRGVAVNEAFCASGLFSGLGNQLLRSSHNEEGFLESLEVLLELHEEEFKTHSEAFLSCIEPIMILVLGALVLWLALGIFLPLWELPLQMQMSS